MEFIIRSKALYSTWVFYKPNRVLFDCGEGISTVLGNKIYGIENIFLTHSHIDHIAGLWGFVNTRNNAMGSREKDLNIYYPKGSRQIKEYLSFILKMNSRLRYTLNIQELEVTDEVKISENRIMKPFKTRHSPGEVSYGYRILEKRKKLKEEYRRLTQEDIIKIKKEKKIFDEYYGNILTISGDTQPISPEYAKNADILLHECTFMIDTDRKIRNHTTLSELKKLIEESKPKKLIVYHVSGRYSRMIKKVEKQLILDYPNVDIKVINTERIYEF